MKGSIEKRGNSWRLSVYLGKDPVTGKERRLRKTVRGSKKDAQKELRDLLHSIDNGTFVQPTKMTVEQYLEQWLKMHKPNIEPTTHDWYTMVCRKHMAPRTWGGRYNFRNLHRRNSEVLRAQAGSGPS